MTQALTKTTTKAVGFLLSVLLLAGLFAALPFTTVSAEETSETVSFLSSTVPAEIAAGQDSTVSVSFANKGRGILYNVSSGIAGDIVKPDQGKYFGNLESGKEGSASFVLRGDVEGTFAVTITLTYETESGEVKNQTQSYSVNVKKAPETDESGSTNKPAGGSAFVLAYTVQTSSGQELQSIKPNEKCQIVIKLRDERFTKDRQAVTGSDGQIANLKITSTGSFSVPSFGDITYTTPDYETTGNAMEYAVIFNDIMYLGGERTFSFDLTYPGEPAALQNISVGISQCVDPKTEAGAKPSLMVQQSSYGGENIAAGTPFSLSITSFNTSKTQGIVDVVTSLSLPASLTLAEGSNTVLTASVAAGGSYVSAFALQAQSSAEAGPANVTVNYTYYLKGSSDPLTASQVITVPIVQPDRFSFTAAEAPTEIYTGEESTYTVNYVNKGKGILYNLSAEISGNMENPGQSQYLGNLNSGTTGSADFVIRSDTAGTVTGTVTVTYEDVNGAEKKQTQEYSLTVTQAPTPMDPGMVDPGMPEQPEGNTGMPWWVWLLIGGGALVVVIVIVVIIKKIKKKKRLRELAEDEDDGDEDF